MSIFVLIRSLIIMSYKRYLYNRKLGGFITMETSFWTVVCLLVATASSSKHFKYLFISITHSLLFRLLLRMLEIRKVQRRTTLDHSLDEDYASIIINYRLPINTSSLMKKILSSLITKLD